MEFTLLCWNVGQARREEQHDYSKWDARSPRVHALINRVGADVVALLELRDLATSSESAQQFLAKYPRYDKVSRRYNHYHQAFTMALLVDPAKFFVGDVRTHNFHDSPQDDLMVMFVDLQCKSTLQWMTIGVTHFAMEEARKWEAVHILRHLITTQRHPVAVYGDYNFFDDREGGEQRRHMLAKCADLAFPLRACTGTFIGFPHDPFRQPVERLSRLDHVFTPTGAAGMRREGDATSPHLGDYCLDNTDAAAFSYPSDHLALHMRLHVE